MMEEKFEQVMEMTIGIPMDVYTYIVELSRELDCSEPEAAIYLFDTAIGVLNNAVDNDEEEDPNKLNIDDIKSMFDVTDD